MTDLLTRAVAAVHHHPDGGHGDIATIERRVRRRRVRRRVVAVTCVVAALVPGALIVARRPEKSIVTADGSIDAGGLAMTGDAGDFFDLEPSVVPNGWRRVLDRRVITLGVCAAVEMRADGPACTATEGPVLVGQVNWLAPSNSGGDTAFDPSDDPGARSLGVATTHGITDLATYVAGNKSGIAAATSTTVRGHPALAYEANGPATTALSWIERAGLLVTVVGAKVSADVVARAAEGIRPVNADRLPLATVVARPKGPAWNGTSGGNNHPYLLAVQRDGKECIDYGFIDGCSQVAEDRLHLVFAGEDYSALGAVPATTMSVDAVGRDGTTLASATTFTVPGFESRFFSIATGLNPPRRVTLHDADGHVGSLNLGYPPLRPSTFPTTIDGVQVRDVDESYRTGSPPIRTYFVPPRTATSASGKPVAIPWCVVLETLDSNAAWCGEITSASAISTGDMIEVIAPAGWTLDPQTGGSMFVDQAAEKPFLVWSYATVDQRMRATPPGSKTAIEVTPAPAISFADLTAQLTVG
jgi:hypothetical protein